MKKEYNIKITTQPMHKGAMAALFLKKPMMKLIQNLINFLLMKKLLSLWKA